MASDFIPEGHHMVTPYLVVKGADSAIQFYTQAFNAVEVSRMAEPDGRIGFAEIQIGDTRLMLSDEFPEIGVLSPQTYGGTPVSFNIYVDDADAWGERIIAAGGKVLRPIADQGDGIRTGIFACPFGHRWFITRRITQKVGS